jgi:hypothetical protein
LLGNGAVVPKTTMRAQDSEPQDGPKGALNKHVRVQAWHDSLFGEKGNLKIQQSREFVKAPCISQAAGAGPGALPEIHGVAAVSTGHRDDDTARKAEFGEQTVKRRKDLAGQRWMVIRVGGGS